MFATDFTSSVGRVTKVLWTASSTGHESKLRKPRRRDRHALRQGYFENEWAGAGVRILIVEDERRLADTVRRGLSNEGFVVDVVHDGVSGVWAATEKPYDVILLDLMLPLKNGYDVLKEIRGRRIWTPVLVLTAKDGEYDQTDAFDLGADDYLTKPFSFLVLVARIRALVRRGAPERPVVLELGSLSLDTASRQVRRGEAAIALTAKEYALLHFLMRRPGQVI